MLLASPVHDVHDLLAEGPVIVAVPHYAAADLVPELDVDGLGASPIVNLHVHYDRRVLDEPLAAALDSPVQFVFDRTEASGAREGQLLAISISHAVDEIGASIGSLRERYLPALERLLPATRAATVLDFAVTHEPRATFRAAPGSTRLRPGTATSVRTCISRARGPTPAGPRRWRARSAAASPPRALRSRPARRQAQKSVLA